MGRAAAAGKTEKKEHLLAETDDMWVALRHKHFADAINEITRTMAEFQQKNKAAAYKQGAGGDGSLDLRNMKNLVSSLPQYRYSFTAYDTNWNASGSSTLDVISTSVCHLLSHSRCCFPAQLVNIRTAQLVLKPAVCRGV